MRLRTGVLGLALLAGLAHAQTGLTLPDYRLQPRQLAADTWVIEGAVDDFSRANGCNIINTAFIATGAGVVVINTGPSRLYGEQQRRAIERITREPVRRVIALNLHPDYFFGHQAWADKPTQALAGTVAGMQAEGRAYADNLYRLCGDWMKGTESTPARDGLDPKTLPQTLQVGGHRLELRRLEGHTADDLVLIDHTTGVLFAGGLVFAERVPTTPHAQIGPWLQSLQAFASTSNKHHRYASTPKDVRHFFTDSTRRTSYQCAFEREVANALPRVFRLRHQKPRGVHGHDAAPIRQLHHVRHALPLRRVA